MSFFHIQKTNNFGDIETEKRKIHRYISFL